MRQNDNARFWPEAMTKSRVFPPHFTLVTCQFIMPLVDFRQLRWPREGTSRNDDPTADIFRQKTGRKLPIVQNVLWLLLLSFLQKVLTPKHLDETPAPQNGWERKNVMSASQGCFLIFGRISLLKSLILWKWMSRWILVRGRCEHGY